ncbi:glucoside xylosyltransferase 1-like [Cotesia glomerata]|uniref:glucoside xylosyltransferase 1-like n=1 Tax=Cotesia glomerata TaxID=32391 RepID=UPI001D008EA5|nr:glucoside xylosyltransferase 1-like [Cotesia glomerata]
MKSLYRFVIIFLCIIGVIIVLSISSHSSSNKKNDEDSNTEIISNHRDPRARGRLKKDSMEIINQEVTICVVVCGDRLDESLTMFKSALVFTKKLLKLIVIAEDDLIVAFDEKLSEWKYLTNNSFTFVLKPIQFPNNSDASMWKRLFKPCAAQRLFLPALLNDTDAILYVDTDTLFLAPPELVWDEFKKMNSTQLAALSPEHEDPNTGWYNRFAKHPYYGKLGVNSGVMLMNLTRMREFRWTDYVIPIHKEYKLKITWGDQDIINIIFHYHPERLYIYPCRYNYRPDHCMYMSVCTNAETEGALVIHGSRGTFHSQKQPPFRAVFRAMQQYQFGTDKYENLFLPMQSYLMMDDNSHCGKVWKVFIIQPEIYIGNNFIN